MNLVLASGSPRRHEILELGGFSHEIFVSNVEEIMDETDPAKLVLSLSKQKCGAVAEMLKGKADTVVIGADTVVAVDGKILGKPHDREEAKAMIKLIAGREHEVFTGVTLQDTQTGKTESFCEKSVVRVVGLSEKEINDYIDLKEPYDKAGGYAIQGAFAKYISGIDGDYYNIMGFPLCHFALEIKKFEENK
jgi:septum formation protein